MPYKLRSRVVLCWSRSTPLRLRSPSFCPYLWYCTHHLPITLASLFFASHSMHLMACHLLCLSHQFRASHSCVWQFHSFTVSFHTDPPSFLFRSLLYSSSHDLLSFLAFSPAFFCIFCFLKPEFCYPPLIFASLHLHGLFSVTLVHLSKIFLYPSYAAFAGPRCCLYHFLMRTVWWRSWPTRTMQHRWATDWLLFRTEQHHSALVLSESAAPLLAG